MMFVNWNTTNTWVSIKVLILECQYLRILLLSLKIHTLFMKIHGEIFTPKNEKQHSLIDICIFCLPTWWKSGPGGPGGPGGPLIKV